MTDAATRQHEIRAGERGEGRGVQSTGARHVLRGPSRGPALIKLFFRNTREEMLEKFRLRYVRTYEPTSSVRSRGRWGGGHISPSKNSRTPAKKENLSWGGDAKTFPPAVNTARS